MHERSISTASATTAPTDAGGSRRLPEYVGPFRVVGVLGVGGMGVVYDAEQESPRRRVALKVIRDSMLHDDDGVRRFAREAEVLARLQHPGIAQVYATGVADGPQGPQPYFAMERVAGQPLGRYAAPLDLRARLALFAQVCDAVHYAHQRGVVHRDLKPANVLVGDDGRPKVLDFGVARLTDADVLGATAAARGLTATGDVVGTLLYMSPEQLSGDTHAVDTRSDVYALGVVLYELLSGRHPHAPSDGKIAAVAHAVLAVDPPSLGTLDRALRGDVETIVAKAIEKDPARRYASAAALAADVRRYLAHEPITARPASAAYQLRKLARRHRGVVAAGAVAAAALVAGTVASAWSAVRARGAERAAVAQRERAEGALGLAERRRAEAAGALALAERRRVAADAERRRADSAARAALRERGLAVASAARATEEAAKATAVSGFLEQVLTSADPYVAVGRDLTVRDVLDSAARRLQAPGPLAAQPAARAAALRTLADSYRSLGVLPPARAAAESAAAVLARTPNAPLHERALAARLLGEVFEASGDREAARRRYDEALTLNRRVRPADRDQEAGLLVRLGALAYYRGDVAASDALLDSGVALARRHHRPPDSFVAELLRTRGEIYTFTGRPARAVAPLREGLALAAAAHGATHPAVANLQRALAYALSQAGSQAEADTLLRVALATSRRLYGGRPHPSVADILDRLGSTLQSRGRHAEAEPLQREALEIRVATLGAGHSDVQLARTQLGRLRAALGRYAEAESLFAQALEARRTLYGPDHGAVASSHLDLGGLALQRGDSAAAERHVREAAAGFDRFGDATFGMVARLRLAQLLLASGRGDEGARVAAEVRATMRARPELRVATLARQLQDAAAASAAAGRPALGDTLAADALAMQRALVPAGSPLLAAPILALARLRARAGDTTGVAALVAEGRSLLDRAASSAPPPAPASLLLGLGESLCALGRAADAADMLRRGVAAAGAPPGDTAAVRRGRGALERCAR
jgi:tetratricopeptide (TPR) repeat protein